MSVMSIGVQGLNQSQNQMEKHGQKIADANRGSLPESESKNTLSADYDPAKTADDFKDLVEPLVYLNVSKQNAQASAKVIQAGSDTIGTLLNMKT